ncbi:MAG TPA: ABC transporter substrate-binding protein [Methanobacteriaceae archaeon]|nr:ABC transporter substrate-binding protein [Methanobacteriaceae archaeon]
MKENFWIIGAIIAILIISFSTYNYLNESSEIIKVGYLPSDHHAALIVAQEMKMFEKQGLKVQLVPFNSGSDIAEALSLQKIDIAYSGITPITEAISNGDDLKIVAPVNLEGSGIVIQKENEISPKSLINQTIAIPKKGSVQDVLLYIYLKNNNISNSEIYYYPSEVPMMPLGLKEGLFKAYVAWEPFVSLGNDYGYGNILVNSNDIWENHPCCVVVTSTDFINKNPVTLRKFLKVHVQSTEYINNHPEIAIISMAKKMENSEKVEKQAMSNIKYIALPNPEFIKNTLKMVKTQEEMKYINKNISYSQIFDFGYLN